MFGPRTSITEQKQKYSRDKLFFWPLFNYLGALPLLLISAIVVIPNTTGRNSWINEIGAAMYPIVFCKIFIYLYLFVGMYTSVLIICLAPPLAHLCQITIYLPDNSKFDPHRRDGMLFYWDKIWTRHSIQEWRNALERKYTERE